MTITVAAGTVHYKNPETGEETFTFYADIVFVGTALPPINAESCIDYSSDDKAAKAAKTFAERFAAAYKQDRNLGLEILSEFKMSIAPEDKENHSWPAIETKPGNGVH